MASRAKIFYNADSQAVRLPKSCRFPDGQGEVVARRVGRTVVLEPPDEWGDDSIAALGAWDDGIERPRSRKTSKKRGPFA
jgi:virulence-associated protein VagC